MIEQILTNPQTVNEWLWFLVAICFVIIVALGGGAGFVAWVTTQVSRAQATTKKIKAEAENVFNSLAPAGSPQQVYIHDKAVEFTKLDLVKLTEDLLKRDIPDNAEERLRTIEQAVDDYVLNLTDGIAEQVAAAKVAGSPKGG